MAITLTILKLLAKATLTGLSFIALGAFVVTLAAIAS